MAVANEKRSRNGDRRSWQVSRSPSPATLMGIEPIGALWAGATAGARA